jgi:hypothetical protein
MLKVIRAVLWLFFAVFALTALLALGGVVYLWFYNQQAQMPYLRWLLGLTIAEVAGTVIMIGKRGIQYLPDVRNDRSRASTFAFMSDFISHGSSVTIVSNRLAWLQDAAPVQQKILDLARTGTQFEIITAQAVERALKRKLSASGVRFYVMNDGAVPEARFTLVNADRSGAEKLAIARGTHPNHEITIFDNSSGPQIIGLAKDIVRKSKLAAAEDAD